MAITIDSTTLPLLGPLVALNIWTFIIEAGMYHARITGMSKAKIDMNPRTYNRNYLHSKLPPEATWISDNYSHLMEQPTQYYALTFALILAGDDSATSLWLSWAYVATRVVHSYIHCRINIINWRAAAFTVNTLILLVFGLRAAALILL